MQTPEVYAACADELSKIAASRARMTVAQSRSGKRPMRVATMLRKDKEGTLYKKGKKSGLPTRDVEQAEPNLQVSFDRRLGPREIMGQL